MGLQVKNPRNFKTCLLSLGIKAKVISTVIFKFPKCFSSFLQAKRKENEVLIGYVESSTNSTPKKIARNKNLECFNKLGTGFHCRPQIKLSQA